MATTLEPMRTNLAVIGTTTMDLYRELQLQWFQRAGFPYVSLNAKWPHIEIPKRDVASMMGALSSPYTQLDRDELAILANDPTKRDMHQEVYRYCLVPRHVACAEMFVKYRSNCEFLGFETMGMFAGVGVDWKAHFGDNVSWMFIDLVCYAESFLPLLERWSDDSHELL